MKRYKPILKESNEENKFIATWLAASNMAMPFINDLTSRDIKNLSKYKNDLSAITRIIKQSTLEIIQAPYAQVESIFDREVKSFSNKSSIEKGRKDAMNWLGQLK